MPPRSRGKVTRERFAGGAGLPIPCFDDAVNDEQWVDDHALNGVIGRGLADRDDEAVIRGLVSAPLPAGVDGLLEAGWALVPLLQTRSGTNVAAAAAARLAAIVGILGGHRLRPGDQQALTELDRHRRRADRSQRQTDLGAAIVVGILLSGLAALVLWSVSLLGTAFLVGTAIAIPVAVGVLYLVIRRLDRDETVADRVRIYGLDVDPELAEALPPEQAIAVDLALRLTPGPIRAWTVDPLVIVAGQAKTAVLARQTLIADATALTESSVESVVELLASYLTATTQSVTVAADIPRPAWAGRWQDPWEHLAYEVSGDAVEWIQWQGVLAGFTPHGVVFVVDLTAISPESPTDRSRAKQHLATVLRREIAEPDSVIVRFPVGAKASVRATLVGEIQTMETNSDSQAHD